MIYISKGHSKGRGRASDPIEHVLHKVPKPLHKSLSITLLDRGTFTSSKILDVVWKHAGYLCLEVVFDHDYEAPNGALSHTYQLYFQWKRFADLDVTNGMINEIMWKIEQDLIATGEFALHGSSHARVRQ